MSQHSKASPRFVTAKTKELLVVAMRANNMRNSTYFKYFDIQYTGTEWVAWYVATPYSIKDELNEVLNGGLLTKDD